MPSRIFCDVRGVSALHLGFIGESGTSDIPGNTSHFVPAGVSIPIWHWRQADRQINGIKSLFGLQEAEIQIVWLLRRYLEQSRIADFEQLFRDQRRAAAANARTAHFLQLQRQNRQRACKQTKKNFAQTDSYVRLTLPERQSFINDVANRVFSWGFARLFAGCIDKVHVNPQIARLSLDEQALNNSLPALNATSKTVMIPTMANGRSVFCS